MAFFVPVLAAIGGGAGGAGAAAGVAAGLSATTGAAIAGGLTVAGAAAGISSAYQAREAGKVANAEYKLQAVQEGDAARGREIERRRSLLSSLATQNAVAGAQGVGIQGSNAAIAGADIRNARNDLMIDTANTKTRQNLLRARGSNAQKAGNAQAISSLIDTAITTYKKLG